MFLILPQAGVVTGTLYELFQVVFQLRQQAGLSKKAPNSAQVSNGKYDIFGNLELISFCKPGCVYKSKHDTELNAK